MRTPHRPKLGLIMFLKKGRKKKQKTDVSGTVSARGQLTHTAAVPGAGDEYAATNAACATGSGVSQPTRTTAAAAAATAVVFPHTHTHTRTRPPKAPRAHTRLDVAARSRFRHWSGQLFRPHESPPLPLMPRVCINAPVTYTHSIITIVVAVVNTVSRASSACATTPLTFYHPAADAYPPPPGYVNYSCTRTAGPPNVRVDEQTCAFVTLRKTTYAECFSAESAREPLPRRFYRFHKRFAVRHVRHGNRVAARTERFNVVTGSSSPLQRSPCLLLPSPHRSISTMP